MQHPRREPEQVETVAAITNDGAGSAAGGSRRFTSRRKPLAERPRANPGICAF
jgi:hypothetical protein